MSVLDAIRSNPGLAVLATVWIAAVAALPWRNQLPRVLTWLQLAYAAVGSIVLLALLVWGGVSYAAAGVCTTAIFVWYGGRFCVFVDSWPERLQRLTALFFGLHVLLYELRRTCVFHNGVSMLDENATAFVIGTGIVVGLIKSRPWAWSMAALFAAWAWVGPRGYDLSHPAFEPASVYLVVAVAATTMVLLSFRRSRVTLWHVLRAAAVLVLAYGVGLILRRHVVTFHRRPSPFEATWLWVGLPGSGTPALLWCYVALIEFGVFAFHLCRGHQTNPLGKKDGQQDAASPVR
jgi:hypothetical protein